MPKLRPEVKEEWVRRLRSGDYPQGKGYLAQLQEDGTHFCCWGVLQDAHYAATGGGWRSPDPESGVLGHDTDIAELPAKPCMEWAFGEYVSPWNVDVVMREHGDRRSLYSLNDEGVPFPVIADLIEEQL